MDQEELRALLDGLSQGEHTVDDVLQRLKALPFESLDGFAHLDHHRALRTGFPEVIFAQNKSPDHVAEIFQRLQQRSKQVLATRVTPEMYALIQPRLPEATYHPTARALYLDREPDRKKRPGVLVVSAGTADLPAAEEAALTASLMGHQVECIYDVGVSGLHRLLAHLPALQKARVIVVAAGGLTLGDLPEGAWRLLDDNDRAQLYAVGDAGATQAP